MKHVDDLTLPVGSMVVVLPNGYRVYYAERALRDGYDFVVREAPTLDEAIRLATGEPDSATSTER